MDYYTHELVTVDDHKMPNDFLPSIQNINSIIVIETISKAFLSFFFVVHNLILLFSFFLILIFILLEIYRLQ